MTNNFNVDSFDLTGLFTALGQETKSIAPLKTKGENGFAPNKTTRSVVA
jgi:hypothetical protein